MLASRSWNQGAGQGKHGNEKRRKGIDNHCFFEEMGRVCGGLLSRGERGDADKVVEEDTVVVCLMLDVIFLGKG